jgi:hypothetical protein
MTTKRYKALLEFQLMNHFVVNKFLKHVMIIENSFKESESLWYRTCTNYTLDKLESTKFIKKIR